MHSQKIVEIEYSQFGNLIVYHKLSYNDKYEHILTEKQTLNLKNWILAEKLQIILVEERYAGF